MNAISASRKPSDQASKRLGFWQDLARRLDVLAAYPARRAVSEQDLRRVDDDIERCRLMIKAR